MRIEDDLYSRVIGWMKIILPLAGLGILSTLFLISRTVDPTQQPIVSEVDLEQRARDQGATNPSFAGVTGSGDEVMIRATRARPDLEDRERMIADEVEAEIRLSSGAVVDITADHADMHQGQFTAALRGDVRIETTTGYSIRTERLDTRYDELHATTPGPVEGTGPPGEITAGRLELKMREGADHAELLFTDGVKLVYRPDRTKE